MSHDTTENAKPAKPGRRGRPPTHGGGAEVALAPQVRGVKRELCRRLGVRYQDLTALGRESVDLYARSRAKLAAIDNWLVANPMLDDEGRPAPCMALYTTLLNTSHRALADLRATLVELAKTDERFDSALQALAAEGARARRQREGENQ